MLKTGQSVQVFKALISSAFYYAVKIVLHSQQNLDYAKKGENIGEGVGRVDDVKFDKLEGRVRAMETRVAVQESNIETLVTNQNKIMDNTDWIRRTVTQAVIVGAVSLVVTIVGGVFFFLTKLS